MTTLTRLKALLPEEIGLALDDHREALYEVHLRAGQPVQLRFDGGDWLSKAVLPSKLFHRALASLMDHSLYAREDELRQGYFTLEDGSRAGVCGRVAGEGMTAVSSLCIRLSREVRGCADALYPRIVEAGGVRSTLILSRPGLGKTTLLRELARRLSEDGWSVCVADERHEIAACRDGVPTMDVGPRTDVMDGGPKREAIMRMLRACAPEVVISDEIGDEGDARALAEAVRCGVSVICSAHAEGFEALYARRTLRLAAWAFELGVLLDGRPGEIREIRGLGEAGYADCAGVLRGGGLRALRQRPGGFGQAEG